MEKFGIFDFINKLTTQNNRPNNSNFSANANQKTQESNKNKGKSNAYKSTIALIKRHDEISKRIDKNNK